MNSALDQFERSLVAASRKLHAEPRRPVSAGTRGRSVWFVRRARGRRRVALFATAGVLVFGGAATAGVIGVEALIGTAPAGTLFRDDPQIWNQNNHNHPNAPKVIQKTVSQVETLSIPLVGNIQFWVARTADGGSCEAFKLPNGVWAGTNTPSDRKYNFGGIVPGCHAPNRSGDVAEGGGFDFDEDGFGPSAGLYPRLAHNLSRVYFGTITTKGAVRVRELGTKRTAPVVDGQFFAITEPQIQVTPTGRFQALSASGKVLSTSWTQARILHSFEHGHGPH